MLRVIASDWSTFLLSWSIITNKSTSLSSEAVPRA